MSTLPFQPTHQGRTTAGRAFVSDAALLLPAEVGGAASAESVEIPPAVMDALCGREAAAWCDLAALRPSERRARVWRTPEDVALGQGHVELLRALGRPLEIGSSGRTDLLVLREGGRFFGLVAPLDVPGDREPLPAPAAGHARGRFHGDGRLLLEDGREVASDISHRVGRLEGGDLVDLQLQTGRDGKPRAGLVWRAGTPMPQAEPRRPPGPPEPAIPREEVLAELHANGLLRDVDGAAFAAVLSAPAGRPLDEVTSAGALHAVFQHYYRSPSELSANEADGVIVVRELHESEEPEVKEELVRFAGHFGVLAALEIEMADRVKLRTDDDDDLLYVENVVEVLGRAFAREGRPERVVLLQAGAGVRAIVVRRALVAGKLRLFGEGARAYDPRSDRRRAEIGFLEAHGGLAPRRSTPEP